MYKAYKFRIYPDTEQQQALAKAFGCCRWYWNYSLDLCQKTYQKTGKSLSRGAIQGLLPALTKEYPWLSDAYSQCLQSLALNLHELVKISLRKEQNSNASINIRNEALRILSLGTSDTANGGSVRRLGGKICCLLDATPNEIGSPNYIACN